MQKSVRDRMIEIETEKKSDPGKHKVRERETECKGEKETSRQ